MPAASSAEVFTDVTVEPFVRGLLHRPSTPNGKGLVITHGSGGNCNARLLVSVAESFTGAGFFVLRCDLPFRQARAYGPPGPGDAKRDRAGLKNAVEALKKNLRVGQVFLGGQSYGGRQASMLCAEQSDTDPPLTPGLLLMSYPLHPPGKSTQLRTQHFFDLRTPALFVSGTRDPFGTISELEQAIKLIPARTKLLPVEGAGHDLGFKGKAVKSNLPTKIISEFAAFFVLSS